MSVSPLQKAESMCRLSHGVLAVSLLILSLANASRAAEVLVEEGALQQGDRRLANDEYYDTFTFYGEAGERILIELSSVEFDTYLMLSFPGGEIIQNDDAGDTQHSFIRAALPEEGTYEVTVTSYEGGETGRYALEVTSDDTGRGQVANGNLSRNDTKLENGEYYDTYTIQGVAGQRLEIRLASDDFNTYLMLEQPDGSVLQNDDVYSSSTNSALRAVIPAGGEYLVHVTSYAPNETGDYRLVIDQIDVRGFTRKGRLQNSDETLQTGEFVDTFEIDAVSSQILDVLLESRYIKP
jgi:hypothetical protein